MYGNIYHQYIPNVSIHTIHGSYGTYMVSIAPSAVAWNSYMLLGCSPSITKVAGELAGTTISLSWLSPVDRQVRRAPEVSCGE